jgi:hypothetical protein
MINDDVVSAFNMRLVDLHKLDKFTPEARAKVKRVGEQAEALLKDPAFAQFIYQAKFEMTDALIDISGFTPEAETKRLAIAHQVAGLQIFVDMLTRAVYYKNKAVSLEAPHNDKGEINE